MCAKVLTFPTSINFYSQCNETTPSLGMNLDVARNDRWVNDVTHWSVSVSISWKYLKSEPVLCQPSHRLKGLWASLHESREKFRLGMNFIPG